MMQNFKWIIDNPEDVIQKVLMSGNFYSADQLSFMNTRIKTDDVVLDLGANVGNHTVYFSKLTKASKVYCIEPIPRAYKLLLANIALNYCHNVNVDYIGLALGDRDCVGYPYMLYGKDNLGSTFLNPEPIKDAAAELSMEPVHIVTGDSLFSYEKIDFIKMDIEGMEIVALDGLKTVIRRNRPKMYIEVMNYNKELFAQWLDVNDYEILETFDRYSADIFSNYYVEPKK
jgi:FkbM family methyltransferase